MVADSSSKAGNGEPEAAETSKILILPLDEVERDSFDEPDFSGVLAEARRLIAGRAYAAACQLLDGELQQATSTGREAGPKTAELLFELGICHYELQDWDAAEQRFREGLAIVRKIEHEAEEGAFLHELSMVTAARGDAVGAINLAREALVSKLRRLTRAVRNSRFKNEARRDEPLAAVDRLAVLLAAAGQWQSAEKLLVFLRDSFEARNDLKLLTKTLIELAVSAAQLGRRDDAETCVARALWSGTISGLNMDQELAARGFGVAPPQPGDGPVQHNVSGRQELERSLIDQFREIALGLLADRLVREADLSTIGWWQQYSTLRCAPPPCMEDPDDPDFQAFQDEIFHLIAVRRLRPISQSELMTRMVKINGAAIPFWQEGTINRHLAEIGSSLRLFVAGRDVVWAAKLLEMLGEPVAEPLCPSHFIFGEIRPMAAIGKANLFDFVREYAVSPYVNTTSAGLHDQGRVVLRDLLLGRALEFLAQSGNEAIDAAAKLMDQQCRALGITRLEVMSNGILGHELGHVHLLFPPGQAAGFQSWHAIVRDDICRFAQVPRSAEEIRLAFRRTFDGLGGIYAYFLTGFPPNESPIHQPLAQTIVALVHDGLLRRDADKHFCFTGFVGA